MLGLSRPSPFRDGLGTLEIPVIHGLNRKLACFTISAVRSAFSSPSSL